MLGGIGGKGEGYDRGWDGWMASQTQWTCLSKLQELVGDGQGGLACCDSWGCRVGHDWVTELNWTERLNIKYKGKPVISSIQLSLYSSGSKNHLSPYCLKNSPLACTWEVGFPYDHYYMWTAPPLVNPFHIIWNLWSWENMLTRNLCTLLQIPLPVSSGMFLYKQFCVNFYDISMSFTSSVFQEYYVSYGENKGEIFKLMGIIVKECKKYLQKGEAVSQMQGICFTNEEFKRKEYK